MAKKVIDVSSMNAELRAEHDYIEGAIASLDKRKLLEYYGIGKKLNKVEANPEMYGVDGLALLVACLRQKHDKFYENRLYTMKKFADTYDDAALTELMALPGPNGKPFPWTSGHMQHLCRLSPARRRAMQVKCAEEGWSVRELQTKVQDRLEPCKDRRRLGRPPSKPKDFSGHLDLFGDMTYTWVDRFNRFGEDFLTYAKESSKWTKDQKAKMTRLAESAQTMIERATVLIEELSMLQRSKNKDTSKHVDDGESRRRSYDEEEFEETPHRVLMATAV